MIYGSVCSGIEAPTVAWHPLGWRPAFFAEIAKFPSAVLAHHYPEVPNLGDFTKIDSDLPIDLLVGGTPCQDFSIAGLRAGLAGGRGNLSLEFGRLAQRKRPRWLVWENVVGVLSSNDGRDFATILGLLAGRDVSVPSGGWRNSGVIPGHRTAYGLAYRVLDTQYIRVDGFGRAIPQRRRRVFVVGYFGDWARAAAVLLERESLCGNPPPRREPGQTVAPTISARTEGGGGLGTDFECSGGLIPEVAWCLQERDANGVDSDTKEGHLIPVPWVAHTLSAEGFDASEDGTGRGTPIIPVAIAFDCKASGAQGFGVGDVSPTLRAMDFDSSHANGGGQVAVAQDWSVRRLTPLECERLQGFADGYTKIPVRHYKARPRGLHARKYPDLYGPAPDGGWHRYAADAPRYMALGNTQSINVMRWIGRRIEMVDAL